MPRARQVWGTISLMALSVAEETIFWMRQFEEHLQFLDLLFTDAWFKRHARELARDYKKQRERALSSSRPDVVIAPMNETVRAYQQNAIDDLKAGKFLGWAFPLFVEHITREIDLYNHLVGRGPAPLGSVGATVKQLGGEHALFAAHLLDPSNVRLVDEANDAATKIFATIDNPGLDVQAAEIEIAIGGFITGNRIGTPQGPLSIIPAALADHVLREQIYFANKLRG